jgi:Ala-tRNA(Pro) deacylase
MKQVTSESLKALLTQLNIPFKLEEHLAVFTVSESQEHNQGKYPVKNLLLKEEKGELCVLVIMKGDERLDTKLIARELGCKKLQFAKADVLSQKLGVTPGSVSLFSIFADSARDVRLVVDSRLRKQDELGFHPNVNTMTVYISGADTFKLIDSQGVSYREVAMS